MDLSTISIRPFTLSDVDDFFKWASDDEVTRYLRWNTILSKEKAFTYLKDVVIPHPFRWSVCLDNHSIGYVSVRPGSDNDKFRAHLSYAVASEYWGHGICTSALRKYQ
ncbi:uncharacterized protein LOC110704124 [Chenopodium quinoa]|uniref:uncharacterized protein LOC110704124 n=1 Tax=Chenopodium quinoa TaxID=63459 RepID=UPI000B77F5FF|nr:uncharacterized protein LOC110704124 [Chenopodium quinoa]